jgi:outer membrane protein assembly factor BamB
VLKTPKLEIMKTITLLLVLLLYCPHFFAQDNFVLKIRDTKGHPLKNIEVIALNQEANDRIIKRTDESGSVVFVLSRVGIYKFSYLEVKNFDQYEVIEGMRGSGSSTVTYDPNKIFVPKEKSSRKGIVFTSVSSQQLKDKPGSAKCTILVKQTNESLVANADIKLVSISDKLIYEAKSNTKGEAVFYLPAGKTYEIDVDGNEALKVIELPIDARLESMYVVFYERNTVAETAKGDTIVQKNVNQSNGTNTHLLFTMKLRNLEGRPLRGEPVYLQEQGGKRVYEGVTDEDGECKVMVSKNANYIVNLKYEQGLHLVEAKKVVGFGQESITRRYRGSAEIERMLAEQIAEMKRLEEEEKILKERRAEEARIQKLQKAEREKAEREYFEKKKLNEKQLVENFYAKKMTPTFRTTPIEKAQAPVDYLKPKNDGFDIAFKSAGPIGTPTVIEDKMYIPAGYYSPSFYCLNANNGQFLWGVQLGESGASPAVYHNGVLLINTYSCTLYALDASTGKLLWSKWLAGTVYSTPSADGNNVYVVYNYGGGYVISCFDLRSGEFKWINRLDSETIACPVVEGNEVHVASQSGFYYVFDKITGKPIDVVTSIVAVSSPTITQESIFITANIGGKDQLVELDRKTYRVKKSYNTPIQPVKVKNERNAMAQMNFNGSHPIVYKNKYVVLLDESKLYVFDALSEKMLWEKSVSAVSSQVPIVGNDNIIVATTDGKVMSFEITSGTSKVVSSNGKEIDAQPVYNKGLLFIASSSVLSVVRTLNSFQWNQWNKDAGHNLYIR